MMKNKALRFAFFGVVLTILAVGVFSLSFHAHAAAPSGASSTTTTTQVVGILKNSSGTNYVFSHYKLTVTHGTPFEFINRTLITQSVTSNGQTVLTINSKTSALYTIKKVGTYTFGLASNTKVKLTVIVQ